MKNLYIILSILVIVIFFYFLSPTFLSPFIESFTVDEYKYLSPPPAGYTWSQDTLTKFTEKWNNDNPNQKSPATEEQIKSAYITGYGVTEEEAKYYIQNGKWPYDSYVVNYIKQNPDIMKNWIQTDSGPEIVSSPPGTSPTGTPVTVSYLSTYLSNRLLYGMLISSIESAQNPQPLSYQIYAGIVPDPNASQTDTLETDTSQSVSPITSSSLTPSSTNLSDSDYNTLFGLCKNIMISS